MDESSQDLTGPPSPADLKGILQHSNDLIALAGTDGFLSWLNPAWTDLLGWSLEELTSRPYIDFVHPDDLAGTLEEAQKLALGHATLHFENRYRCKDGSWRWLSWNTTPRDDGTLFCVCRDVTKIRAERREQEARIRQLELAEGLLKVGNWRVDLVEQTVYWSPVVYEIHGRDPAVYTPSLEDGILAYHPDDRDEVRWSLERAVAERGSFGFALRVMCAKTGRARYVRSSGTVQCSDDGEPHSIIGVFQDVTELMHGQEQLREANYKLEMRMGELEERSTALRTMSTLGDMLQSALDMDESKDVLRTFLPQIFKGLPGMVFLTETGSDHQRVASWGSLEGVWRGADLATCWAVRRGTTHAVDACGALRCRHLNGVPLGSRCVPMLAHGKLVGLLVLAAGDADQQARLDALQNFPSTVANQIALAVSNLRLRERLRNESLRDQLTGLYNRRFLDDWLAKQISRAGRGDEVLSVAMLDLDRFKCFNDTHGHLTADRVLAGFAHILAGTMRAGDVACRWGGEEFLIALPGCGAEDVGGILGRIQDQLAQLPIEDETGRSVAPPTVSGGVATFPPHANHAEALVHAADQALFAAKTAGRNTIVHFHGELALAA